MFSREVSILNFAIILLCKFNIHFHLTGGGGGVCRDPSRSVHANSYFSDSVTPNENTMLITKHDIFSRNLHSCENEHKVFTSIQLNVRRKLCELD